MSFLFKESDSNVSENVRLSGWVHRKRDHGGLLFIDVRDHFGITQCVTDVESDVFNIVEPLRVESVVKITGAVVKRSDETINNKIPSGSVEVRIKEIEILSSAEQLPLQVNAEEDSGEAVSVLPKQESQHECQSNMTETAGCPCNSEYRAY